MIFIKFLNFYTTYSKLKEIIIFVKLIHNIELIDIFINFWLAYNKLMN